MYDWFVVAGCTDDDVDDDDDEDDMPPPVCCRLLLLLYEPDCCCQFGDSSFLRSLLGERGVLKLHGELRHVEVELPHDARTCVQLIVRGVKLYHPCDQDLIKFTGKTR